MKPLTIRDFTFAWGTKTYVMGILNITPDSFSGDGLLNTEEVAARAVDQAVRFAEDGAHILDIGGESTRPGAQAVDEANELSRIVPVIEAVRAAVDLPISIDTYKAGVAEAALTAGADIVNDVWGLRMDDQMGAVCARHNAPVIVMHNRSNLRNAVQEARLGGRYIGAKYDDLLTDISRELQVSIDLAHQAGIPDGHIIIDTGIGFGKTVAQNLELLDRTDHFQSLGYPILIGASNKSFIGYTLDLPPNERTEGTAATVAVAIARGADIVRVHNVQVMARVAKMTDAMVRRNARP